MSKMILIDEAVVDLLQERLGLITNSATATKLMPLILKDLRKELAEAKKAHGPMTRRAVLRQHLLSEEGLTAEDCKWVEEVKEGDFVKLRGGKSVTRIASVSRQKGLAPDYFNLALADGSGLQLSGDELADLYEPAEQPAQPAPVQELELEYFRGNRWIDLSKQQELAAAEQMTYTIKPQDHPDLAGGWVWTPLEIRWIEQRLSDERAKLTAQPAPVQEPVAQRFRVRGPSGLEYWMNDRPMSNCTILEVQDLYPPQPQAQTQQCHNEWNAEQEKKP